MYTVQYGTACWRKEEGMERTFQEIAPSPIYLLIRYYTFLVYIALEIIIFYRTVFRAWNLDSSFVMFRLAPTT
jgi:hypothetical protein